MLATVPAVAVKVAVVLLGATVTVAGTVNAVEMLSSVMVAPPVLVTVTVQVELPPGPRLEGLQLMPLKVTRVASEIVAVCVLPFSVAVMVAVWLLAMVPAVAVKVAVVLAAATVTDAGTVNAAALSDSVTVAPPVFDTVTVHVALPPDPRLAGVHVSPLTTVAVASAIVAVCVLPFSVAVMVAVWLLAIVPVVAVKIAVALAAATVTEAGTVNAAALSDSATVAPPVFDTVTVHVALPPDPKLAGVQVSPLSTTGATSEIAAVCVLPFSVAVMVAVWLLAIVPAVAVKVAVVLAAATVTEAGTVNAAALSDSVTAAPPVFDTVTVHVELPPDPRLAGVHVSPLTTTGATSEIAAVCVLPFKVAVMIAVWLLAIVPAVAVKVAVVLAAATVTEAGTVNAAALSDSVTVAPPVFDTVTVQVDVPPVLRDAGVQLSALRVGGGGGNVPMPPTPLMGSVVPPAVVPNVFATLIVVLATPGAIVTLTTATTPFCITPVLTPYSRQT